MISIITMRPLPLLALLVSVLVSGTAAEPETPNIVLTPKSITVSSSTTYTEEGTFQRNKSQVRLSLRLKPPAGTQIAASRGVVVKVATSDTGESLLQKGDQGNNGRESFGQHERDESRYDVDLDLGSPKEPMAAIRELSGTVTLSITGGATKQAIIAPIKDWLGKVVSLEAVNEDITVERSPEGTTLRGSREFFERLQKIIFTDAAGNEIKVNGWGGGSDNDTHYRTWRMQVPDNGGVTLQLLPNLTDVTVPFHFTDLPLKAASAPKPTGAKIKVTDVPGPNKPEAAGVSDPGAAGAKGF